MFYPIIIFILILSSSFIELIVFNEEVLLLLCFIAFCSNAFVYAQQSTFDSFNQRALNQKAELLVFTKTASIAKLDALDIT